MIELDQVLRDSNPAPTLPDEWAHLAVELARSKTGRRPRRPLVLVIASIVGGTLLVGGGVAAAAAQAGWIFPGPDPYVDGADLSGVLHVTVKDGTRFDCTYALHAEADYQQSASYQRITDGVAEAHRFLRTLDPKSIKTNPAFLQPGLAVGDPQYDSLDKRIARGQLQAFISTVIAKVNRHQRDVKFPDVGMSAVTNCNSARAK